MKAKEFIPAEKPRNFVAKNAKMGGAGAHKDKKKAEKQGDVKHKNKEYAENVEEGWKDKVAAAGLAGAMAFGASGASARVMPGDDPGINRLTGKPIAAQQATDNAPAKAEAPKGFSKEYLQSVVDGKHPRPMVSVEKAKELLKNMSEGSLKELSTEKLAQYKKAAYADAKQSDADGKYARGDKRFSGINKATSKQFDNDLKKHRQQGVAEAGMYTKPGSPSAYDRDYRASVSGMGKKDSLAYQQDGGANDEYPSEPNRPYQAPQDRPVLKGYYFYNVQPGQEDDAGMYGVKKTKSGKWAKAKYSTSGRSFDMQKDGADKAFGAGKWWSL